MKRISIRQFQRNFYTELKEVPFIVLRQVWEGEDGQKKAVDKPEFIVAAYTPDSPLLAEPASQENTEVGTQPIIPRKPSFFDKAYEEDKPTLGTRIKRIFGKNE